MKNSRLEAFTVFAIWVAFCAIVQAQQPRKIPTIGYLSVLSPSSDSARIGGFRQSLAELGYVDGQNVTIQPRYAEGKLDRLPKLAGELVGLDVDVIVAGGSTAIRAVKNATKVIPIIMAHGSDPVELGYVASLARPGGNITGLTHLAPELGGKRLELLKDIVAKLSRVAVLTDPGAGGHAPQMKELVSAAPGLDLELRPIEIRSSTEVEKAFSVLKTERAGALIGIQVPTLDRLRGEIVQLATKHKIPGMYPNEEYVDSGGLMSYAADIVSLFRRSATLTSIKFSKVPNPEICRLSNQRSSS